MNTATPDRAVMNGKPVFTLPVKSVLNLHSGFEKKLLCDGPTFSLGDACTYSCSFCYVPAIATKFPRISALRDLGARHEEIVVRRANALEILKNQLVHPNGKPKFAAPSDRRVVFSSPLVDCAGNMDLVRETVAACKLILQHTHWQIRLLSKSNLLPKVALMLLDEVCNDVPWPVTTPEIYDRMIFGVSTGTLDDQVAAVFEEGAPRVSKRIASLHWLQDHGFRTFAMICPSLPLLDVLGYHEFAGGCADTLRTEKCEHVYAEVINARGDALPRTILALETGGHRHLAAQLLDISQSKSAWETYNRATFLAHAEVHHRTPGKLRYLAYTTAETHAWWAQHAHLGAVLL